MSQSATYEPVFQTEIVILMQVQDWQLSHTSGYTAETVLYEEDVLDFRQSRR